MCLFLGVRTKKCQAALPPQASSEYRDLLIGLFAKLLRGPLLLQAEDQQGIVVSQAAAQMLSLSDQVYQVVSLSLSFFLVNFASDVSNDSCFLNFRLKARLLNQLIKVNSLSSTIMYLQFDQFG